MWQQWGKTRRKRLWKRRKIVTLNNLATHWWEWTNTCLTSLAIVLADSKIYSSLPVFINDWNPWLVTILNRHRLSTTQCTIFALSGSSGNANSIEKYNDLPDLSVCVSPMTVGNFSFSFSLEWCCDWPGLQNTTNNFHWTLLVSLAASALLSTLLSQQASITCLLFPWKCGGGFLDCCLGLLCQSWDLFDGLWNVVWVHHASEWVAISGHGGGFLIGDEMCDASNTLIY